MARVRDLLIGTRVNGAKLRALRLKARLRQEDVAQAAGISPYWLRKIELHGQRPSRPVVEDIAALLGVDPTEFTEPIPADEDGAAA